MYSMYFDLTPYLPLLTLQKSPPNFTPSTKNLLSPVSAAHVWGGRPPEHG